MLSPQYLKSYGIGLTGSIATGKSTVAQIIRNQGFPVIDADSLSRLVVEPPSPLRFEIVKLSGIPLLGDQTLDRKGLRNLIAQQPEFKKKLEALMHPAIHKELEKTLECMGLIKNPRLWFYEASLIVETGFYTSLKSLWVTHCPEPVQLQRLMARDHMPQALAAQLMTAQMPSSEKVLKAHRIISTDCSPSELESQICALLTELRGSL